MTNSNQHEPIIYDFDPHNLPDEYLRAIGLVVASASQTESILQNFIGAILKVDLIEARALTAHMSMPLKMDIARSLGELNAPSVRELDALDDLLDRIWDAMQKRNALAHNSFARNPNTGQVLSFRETARGSFRGKLTPILAEEIEHDAEVIYNAGMDLQGFMMARGLGSISRIKSLRAPIKRSKEARAKRSPPNRIAG